MKVKKEELTNGCLICIAVCAADGFISEEEEEVLEGEFLNNYEISSETFQIILDQYFSSSKNIEDWLETIKDEELQHQILLISKKAAAIDGLDIAENIVWEKCNNYWGELVCPE